MRRWLQTLCVLTGCAHDATAPDVSTSFTTDKSLYVAAASGASPYVEYHVTVIARYANEGQVPIELGTCLPGDTQPVYSVRLVGDSVDDSAFNPAWGCVGGSPALTLAPGQVRTDTLLLEGPDGRTSSGVALGVLSGQMQIVYDSSPTAAASNTFTIQLP